MIQFKKISRSSGQALIETLLIIPLLFLLTAGVIQFTILFQARSAFDKACGEAARQYAANHLKDSASFISVIWTDLGPYQPYFKEQSLNLTTQAPQATIADIIFNSIGSFGPLASQFKSYVINYTGQSWTATIYCAPPSLVTVIFPNGIQFQSQLTVLKYPS